MFDTRGPISLTKYALSGPPLPVAGLELRGTLVPVQLERCPGDVAAGVGGKRIELARRRLLIRR